MNLQNMMRPAQVAKLLKMKPDTVRTLIKNGDLAATNVAIRPSSGRPRYLISQASLDEFLASRRVKKPAKTARRKRQPAGVIEFF